MTRDEQIARLEELGHIVRDCPGCKRFFEAVDPVKVFAPNHKPSRLCASGGRPHCTCDTCF